MPKHCRRLTPAVIDISLLQSGREKNPKCSRYCQRAVGVGSTPPLRGWAVRHIDGSWTQNACVLGFLYSKHLARSVTLWTYFCCRPRWHYVSALYYYAWVDYCIRSVVTVKAWHNFRHCHDCNDNDGDCNDCDKRILLSAGTCTGKQI